VRSAGKPAGPRPAAQPSCGGGPRCALTVRSLRVSHAHAGAVTHSTVVRWELAGGKVLPASTDGVLGWCRARGVEAGLMLAVAQHEGAERRRRRRSGGRCRGSRGSGERRGGPTARAEVREVAEVRCQSGEGKIVVRGRKFGWWRRLHFKGERRGGGARRGGHHVEAEQERGRKRGGLWAQRG
jgi:hypothetical protein